MQVHCISISEHIWVGGCGPRDVGELPAGGIRASQGTFSSSCSTQLSLKFILQINVKMPSIVGILTFMSRINYQIFRLNPEFSTNFDYFNLDVQLKFHAQLS